ncbi:MAG TPA: DUF5709 domain-containing protein [Nocardioidaceae bacterium]|nr:DUF5709 domain-containing protein [Nocardioidaceae bacterium]
MSQQPDERETYHGYSVDDEDQPQGEGDALVDNRGLDEPLDEGYSPPEKWSAGEAFGNTPLEEAMGESLDQRVAQEVEEPDPYAEADAMSVDEIEGRDDDEIPEVGDVRAGRLVDQAEGVRDDTEKDLVAEDVGVDGAGASAEEAAVHVIREEGLPAQSSADDLGDLA